MANDRQVARQQIEKLVQFFDSNIYQFKSPSFNETQARQQLIDPFFESLGWDMHNRSMKPLFRQEVVPESRVKSSVTKEVKEQEPLFPKKGTLGKEHKKYASILDYIAEDEYKASSKEAVKKPDYRFRIGGQTKFFVEAKKPYVDLAKSQSAIFQVKRYGFSGRVPLAILTDFEEFRTFDCTQRPLFEKPKLGIIHDFDLTYKHYLDQFDRLYDTFSRDAVAGGSLEALTKKMMLKRTGDFALDREFLEDLSKWREELARDIAKHPKNRRLLNDYTLNEAVQRILDRIVFIRVCEDREIEVENTLLAILRMWKERRGLSLYSLLNDLFKQRRALYNGLLFSSHPCEELEVGNEVLIKILENLNYPFSPYHFNEIGVEILGSIYEKFLGKTIHLTAKTTRIEEKPEVRKAGGVYYTPQYIVKYIVDNTLGKLLYEEEAPSAPLSFPNASIGNPEKGKELDPRLKHAGMTKEKDSKRTLKLSPKQVAKLKIIDIACGSGSFLLGAFQKLIDYHIEWYTAHPEDIKTENNVPDAYKDTEGNYHLSPRKKRDILVNNIYGVDIDRQAVEVTQMSLYLKVLEGENAETLNPQMTLALKEVYLPSLAKNIKCGNSLIGTDFTSQGALFDDEARRKVNPFDWEMEFPEILGSKQTPTQSPPYKGGEVRRTEGVEGSHGFDVVIGNPPYGAEFNEEVKTYFFSRYLLQDYQLESYLLFLEKALGLLRKDGLLGYIIPNPWLTNLLQKKIRIFIGQKIRVLEIVHYLQKVFHEATVDTEIVILQNSEPLENEIQVSIVDDFAGITLNQIDQKLWQKADGKPINIFLKSKEISLVEKICAKAKVLETFCKVTQGAKPYQVGKGIPKQTRKIVDEHPFDSTKKKNKTFRPLLRGSNINRYVLNWNEDYWISFGDWLAEPRYSADFDAGEKIVIRQTGDSLIATIDKAQFIVRDNLYTIINKSTSLDLRYILGLLNCALFDFYYQTQNPEKGEALAQVKATVIKNLPIRTIDFDNPAEKKIHDDLVSLVEKMLELNKQLQKAHFDSEKEPIERQIAATDKKIDDIVYELYELTPEEIAIIEGKSS
jgi:type I restriction-modification system DNA methylase subunit